MCDTFQTIWALYSIYTYKGVQGFAISKIYTQSKSTSNKIPLTKSYTLKENRKKEQILFYISSARICLMHINIYIFYTIHCLKIQPPIHIRSGSALTLYKQVNNNNL